jgi:hypothetical protein
MSEVTNLIFTFSHIENEGDRMKDVNLYNYHGQNLNLVSADYLRGINLLGKDNRMSWYGGNKFLEAPVYIGAYNNFDLNDFIDYLKLIEWEEIDNVQIIVKEQEDETFRIVGL